LYSRSGPPDRAVTIVDAHPHFAEVVDTTREFTASFTEEERRMIFGGNASRFYGLAAKPGAQHADAKLEPAFD